MLNENQIIALKALAKQVVNMIELRKNNNVLKIMQTYLEDRNSELEKIEEIITNKIKPVFSDLFSSVKLLHNKHFETLNNEGKELINKCVNYADEINKAVIKIV